MPTDTFYRYFDDKHEVYLEIMRRTIVGAYEETIAKLTPEKLVGGARTETIAAAVGVLFDHVLSRPQLTRSFMERSLSPSGFRPISTCSTPART